MATTPIVIDAETMDMNELRKLAEEEARKATTTTTTTTPPATTVVTPGATGEEEEETTTTQPEVKTAPKVFYAERTIDLGDGAGVQVFRGKGASREDALEEALDKFADAQRNATKKIREQAAKLKAQEATKGPTKEEESLLAAEIVTNPSKVVKNILGIDPSELKEVVAEVRQTRANKQKVAIGNQFVSTHPEFLDNERNGQRLFKAASLFGEFNLENLEKAYQDLTESGLLEVKGEEASAEQKKAEAEQKRIADAAEATSSQRTRKTSGLSTHNRSAVAQNTEPSEDELYSMPLDKLRALSNKALAG